MDEVGRLMQPPLRRFATYPEYGHSGIEWLGDIPAHWEVKPLKHLATLNDEVLSESTDSSFEIAYVDISSVDTAAGITDKETLDFGKAPSRARRIVRHGDVIVSTVRTYLRAIAAIKAPGPNLIVSTGFAVVRPRHLASSFATYALRAPHFVESVVANSVGVSYPAINASRLACFPVPYPDVDEQRLIADFLDRETAKIDALVAKKVRLVELLQEKRTALITRAVTRGLDPKVPMKDSGVEWLGEVPTEWDVRRLKLLLQEPLHYGANEPAELMDPDLPRYIRITDIGEDGRLREETFRSIPEDAARPHLLREGDLLFARSGATVGKTFRFGMNCGRAAHAGYLVRARFNPLKCISRFVQYFTLSTKYWDWLRSSFIQATIQNVSADRYAKLEVPLPQLPDRQAIVGFLDSETARIDALIDKVRQAIDHIHEFRTALISAAVTGKIDVRKAKPQ